MTYDQSEDISFRVSKLEEMIKENVKMDDLGKLENKMDNKEYLQELKDIMKDRINIFIPHSPTQ